MIISQTPLRISLVGGGTDIKDYWASHGGMVLSSAIDKYIFVIIKSRFDDKIILNYTKREIVDKAQDIQHELVKNALLKTNIKKGVEIWTPADIPSEGSGLGSSSTLTVGLLNAFYTYKGYQIPAEQLAREACEIEIDLLNKPIGKQDQYIAAYGGVKEFTFHSNGTVTSIDLLKSAKDKLVFGSNLLLFFTNITRKSSEILRDQNSKLSSNMEILSNMKAQVPAIKKQLHSIDNFNNVGHILDKAWQMKKKLSTNITNPIIDSMYEKAKKGGALGGKLSGAGGGGFLLLFVPRENQNNIRQIFKDHVELPFMLDPHGSKIIFNNERVGWK